MGMGHAHPLVLETALKMALEVYETYMSKVNKEYKDWKEAPDNVGLNMDELAIKWAHQNVAHYLRQARATLAQMLRTNIAENLKEQIADALIKDAQLVDVREKAEVTQLTKAARKMKRAGLFH